MKSSFVARGEIAETKTCPISREIVSCGTSSMYYSGFLTPYNGPAMGMTCFKTREEACDG